ncbi:peptidoglycan-associated lipoprotein Pal [Halochromatium glycolicum]|uniref:Peptidoglycan-associated lipoprotein n=1 Tax=Halochromatium glycolicum TaxID=85075 RepID=A0AAJ0X9G7_9GAMM|nr:peptidoglycan-associated lipoprotein Pal [Halochromatium glycolicum]MBK1704060.1 peptidoglycan-associated lipoprotein [Halochromatium glycolicum]
MSIRWQLSLSVLVLALTGCATPPPPPTAAPSADELDAMGSRPAPGIEATRERSPLDDPASPLYRKVVYFEYDAARIQPQYAGLLRAHADYIYNTPGAEVTLEGHSDERGTREYNLALGDRRSDAVKRFLMAEGVPEERIRTLSYGEERPADPGRTERAWSENRRVELVY